jgi:hypothetical protein
MGYVGQAGTIFLEAFRGVGSARRPADLAFRKSKLFMERA